ncbi:ComEC/Rec2 family competence protein [Burkholderia anthina]|uniref:ComEC/Rec2 family competence protein n=1 Tax=Burkholderia anthina TaxID=179879 RepID=UPI0037C0B662
MTLDAFLQIFDVDHGQCALLTVFHPTGARRVLIDCGHSVDFKGGPWYPGRHLSNLGVDYIDLLVCTNYDEDHASGFPDLERQGVTVGCILGNPTVAPETIVHLKTADGMGDGIRAIASTLAARRRIGWAQTPPIIPGVNLTWSWNPYPHFDDENNLSLVLTLNILGFSFMFPGDMETKGFDHLLNTCPPFRQTVAGVHVLIAAHHGRSNGICTAMFDTYNCKPQLVVISDDYKQYETQETTDYYAQKVHGVPWFRDDGRRFVLTTRSDSEVRFSFQNGYCTAW